MIKNRQALADAVLTNPPKLTYHIKSWLRHKIRLVVFSIPLLRRLMERESKAPEELKGEFDQLMSQTSASTYLGGTINVDGVNAMTAILLKYRALNRPSIMDIGCSGGTLVTALHSFSKYFGTDVSTVAVGEAQQMVTETLPDRLSDIKFKAVDLRQFEPASGFDVIVFNEVLYYLNSEQAVAEVRRYAKTLNKNGLIVASMRNDGKSRAIFSLLLHHFEWVDGILWQRKATSLDYSIRPNRERPAFLVGALRVPS
jgi:2-polyprenyl-3-methyl-5-hydroxy-6-metoxy-1,4-benzoquinol methylase